MFFLLLHSILVPYKLITMLYTKRSNWFRTELDRNFRTGLLNRWRNQIEAFSNWSHITSPLTYYNWLILLFCSVNATCYYLTTCSFKIRNSGVQKQVLYVALIHIIIFSYNLSTNRMYMIIIYFGNKLENDWVII